MILASPLYSKQKKSLYHLLQKLSFIFKDYLPGRQTQWMPCCGWEYFPSIVVPSQRIMTFYLLLKSWFLDHWNILRKKITKNRTSYSSHSNFAPYLGLMTELFLTCIHLLFFTLFLSFPVCPLLLFSMKFHSEVCSYFLCPLKPVFFSL